MSDEEAPQLYRSKRLFTRVDFISQPGDVPMCYAALNGMPTEVCTPEEFDERFEPVDPVE